MQIARSSYPILFGIYFIFILPVTIANLSDELNQQFFFISFGIGIVLLLMGIIIAIMDKELFHITVDERTKKVDRSSGYYSWWATIVFSSPFFIMTAVFQLTAIQILHIILNEMIVTILIFHMYFNFKGKEALDLP